MADIRLHKGQSSIIRFLFPPVNTPVVRYAPVVASRGFGKSYVAASAACIALKECLKMPYNQPNKNVSIIAPTHSQAVDIYYPLLAYGFGLEKLAYKSSRDTGRFLFRNGTELRLWSYEAIERMRGTGQYFCALDEVTTWEGKPGLQEAWESIILPAMVTRWPKMHRAMIITTPKGYDYFYDMTNMQEKDDRYKTFHFTYKDSPLLSTEDIEKAKATTDPLKFAREYMASFEESGANVFHAFSRAKHVSDQIHPEFYEGEAIHACIDFNVGIQATSIFALRGGQMQFINEMQGAPDTETLAVRLTTLYKGRKIYAYPDPSGKARKSSAPVGVTDFTILQSHGIEIRVKAQVPLIDSVNAVNRMLENAHGQVNMMFHPKVTNTIKSIERTAWVEKNPNTATIDKSGGVEHWSDGIRYGTQYLFPISNHKKTSIPGFMF